MSCEPWYYLFAGGSTEGPMSQTAGSPAATGGEETQQSEDQNDVWKKLTDFAG